MQRPAYHRVKPKQPLGSSVQCCGLTVGELLTSSERAMAFVPDDISDWLAAYDIHGSAGSKLFPARANLLCRISERRLDDQSLILHIEQYTPEGQGIECLSHDLMEVAKDSFLQRQIVEWTSMHTPPPMNQMLWMRNVIEVDTTSNFVFDGESCWLPLHMDFPTNRPIHHLEFYAGGAGGWKSATKFLQDHFGDTCFSTIAIEHDLELATTYALTHSANMINTCSELSPHAFMEESNWVVVADVSDPRWQSAICHWQVDVCSISSPCPPWSGANTAPGLLHPNGLLLLRSILDCRFWRPHMILIEQVPGFAIHDHRKWIERALHMIGYKLLWHRTMNVSSVLRTNRPRWLAVAVRIHADFRPEPLQDISLSASGSATSSVKFRISAIDLLSLKLDDTAKAIASDPAFASQFGVMHPQNPDQIFASRVYEDGSICPTFMAKYGTQHQLDDNYLRTHQYFGHFVKEDHMPFGCRHWHPAEITLKHGCTQRTFLWDSLEQSWLIVGNMITPAQAMIPLAFFLNQLRPEPINMSELVAKYQSSRLFANEVCFHRLEGGYFMVPLADPMTDQQLTHAQTLIDLVRRDDREDFIWFHDPTPLTGNEVNSRQITANGSPVTQVSQPTQEASATVPFDVILQGIIKLDDHTQKFWFSATVPFHLLISPWNWLYTVQPDESHEPGSPAVSLWPSTEQHFVDDPHLTVAAVLQDDQITVVALPSQTCMMQSDVIMGLSAVPHDEFGPIVAHQKPNFAMLLMPTPIQPGECQGTVTHIVAAYQQITGQVQWSPHTDTLMVALQGDDVAVATFANFLVHALPPTELMRCGRTVEQMTVSGASAIFFKPFDDHGVCPPRQFSKVLSIQAVRLLLDQCQSPTRTDADTPVRVKWMSRPLWNGFLHDSYTMSTIMQIMSVGLFLHCGPTEFRIVSNGKQILPDVILSDLDFLPHADLGEAKVLNVVQRIHGGGPSKTQQRTLQQGALATLFLEQGYDLPWVTSTVDKLISKLSLAKIQNATGLPMGSQRVKTLFGLCDECGIEVPQQPKLTSLAKPAGAPWNRPKKPRKEPEQIDPTQFRIVDQYFRNQDDTPAAQIFDLRPQSTGIYMSTGMAAVPWLRAGQKVSSDELGLLVVGQLPIETQLESQSIKVPCLNKSDQMVLLTCQLVQLGSKQVQCQKSTQQQVATDNSTLVALTINKDNWHQDVWWEFLHATNATFRKYLQQDALDYMTSIWGRSMRAGRSPASPAAATSLQVHVTIPSVKLEHFLSKSGFNHIFATPKLQDGGLDSRFKVVWMKDASQVTVIAATLKAPMGMVRGKDSVGLRVGDGI
eukprot:Skav210368  [mRNA]  locus=scaffold1357:254099:258043:- [translate_table: standard]